MIDDQRETSVGLRSDATSLSYKFERLREKLRSAIASGELTGKLPGERALSKRFHVNAKTLSKALTDLAAEGLLHRQIGLGTYVRGTETGSPGTRRSLLLCSEEQSCWEIVELLRKAQPQLDVLTDSSSVRPSFLNQFDSVIDLDPNTPDSFIRDLVVRNIPVVIVGKQPRTYSTHVVAFDGPLAVSLIARDLLLSGHRKLAAIEPRHCTVVRDALQSAASRYAPETTISAAFPQDVLKMVEHGTTAFVCQNVELAKATKHQLETHGVAIPQRVSVAALGSTSSDQPVSGYFMQRTEKVAAIVQLLEQKTSRPTTIWLAGQFVDRGTMAAIPGGNAGGSETGASPHQSEVAA